MKQATGIITILTISLFAAAQKPALKFDKQQHDFGEVQYWNNPPAYFLFTNSGKTEFLFLPTFQRKDIFVDIPRGAIPAGTTDTIAVYYFTDQPGVFEQSVELYTSTSGIPVKLSVKGNIISLDDKAYLSCPGFAPKIRVDELALVLDSFSVEPAKQQTISSRELMEFEELEQEEIPLRTTPPLPAVNEDIEGLLASSLYAPNNIIFLIDVSYSMKKPDKLPLLKISMKNLTGVLRGIDYLSVITYSTTSQVMLPATPVNNKEEITVLIDTLKPHGITNGVKGLKTAYEIAEQNFIRGGNNQVIIATDGIFNSPNFSEGDIYSLVRDKADDDIKLSVVGFGDDKEAIRMMKKMADRGEGSFIQIPDKLAADEILIEEIKMQSAIGNN